MSSTTRTAWVVGNWKMNPTWDDAQRLLEALAQGITAAQSQVTPNSSLCQLAIAPPTLMLLPMQFALAAQQIALQSFAQDVSRFSGLGAYTGEVSAQLLADTGVQGVLIGHSERREYFAEAAEVLQAKLSAALQAGLTVIYCVGETLDQREQVQAEAVVSQQLCDIAEQVSEQQWPQMIIAYEPVWAIGTGKTASPADAQAMHAHIRAVLSQLNNRAQHCSILYGGSVKPENAVELAACPDIDGALVGGASLNANSFLQIARAFAQAKAAGV